jgi:hypothetical protein
VRKGDTKPYSKLRPSRFHKESGRWYFQTREGSTEGPFKSYSQAEARLGAYLMIFKGLRLEVFNPGFRNASDHLALEPIQMQWR